MSSESQTTDSPESAASRDDRLEELTERTAEVMARARRETDRAKETLHDQILGGSGHSGGTADDSPAASPHTDAAAPDHDTDWLGRAITLARDNAQAGGRPFGAVIVQNGKVLASAANTVLADDDPTAHAELTAIREACAAVKNTQLTDAVLYSSCEPCPMCLAAALWAGVKEIVYGASRDAATRVGFEDQEIHDLLTGSRDDWPMTMRHQETGSAAEAVLDEWSRRHQSD